MPRLKTNVGTAVMIWVVASLLFWLVFGFAGIKLDLTNPGHLLAGLLFYVLTRVTFSMGGFPLFEPVHEEEKTDEQQD